MTSPRPSLPDDVGAANRVTFRLAACLQNRALAIDLVSTLITHVAAADAAFRSELITAFSEAFNNIVLHSYEDRSDGILDVDAELRDDGMTLKLMDDGRAFDLDAVSIPDLDGLPERGMGVFMIRSMVDEVVYESGRPNVLLLTKRAPTSSGATE